MKWDSICPNNTATHIMLVKCTEKFLAEIQNILDRKKKKYYLNYIYIMITVYKITQHYLSILDLK